jgi:hypothetical protein
MGKMDKVGQDQEASIRKSINTLKAEKLELQTDIRAKMHQMTALGGQIVKQRAKLEKIRKAKRQAILKERKREAGKNA